MFSGLPFEGLRLKTDPRSPSSTLPSYYDEAGGPGLVAEWEGPRAEVIQSMGLAVSTSGKVWCAQSGHSNDQSQLFQVTLLVTLGGCVCALSCSVV